MGCSSCGQKRKKAARTVDAPLIDASGKIVNSSFLKWSDKNRRAQLLKRSARKNMVGGMIEPNKIRNIISLKRTDEKINIQKQSKKEKAVYIIGNFKGCSACKYMHKLIDKIATPKIKMEINFYSVSKDDVQMIGFSFSNNPVVLFVKNGKIFRQFAGLQPNIISYIEDFYNQSIQKQNTKEKQKIIDQKHVVYKLKPSPTHIEAYESLLDDLKQKDYKIKNITTFVDKSKNLLVVTIDFK